MKRLLPLLTPIACCFSLSHAQFLVQDNFNDLAPGSLLRSSGHLRGDGSGPVYLVAGTQAGIDAAAFTAVDATALGGGFSGTALQFNFSTNARFLYLPYSSLGWNDGDKLRVSFDFAYSSDPTDQATSLWMSMHNQRDVIAGVDDILTTSTVFQDDSGHSLKIAEKTAGALSGGQYGFANARMTSSSANFHNGPIGLDGFIQGIAPVRIGYELERVANAFEFEGAPVSGTLLSVYINDVLVDTAPVTALVVDGEYSAFALWGRGTGVIDNFSIEYTAVPEPRTFALLAGLLVIAQTFWCRRR